MLEFNYDAMARNGTQFPQTKGWVDDIPTPETQELLRMPSPASSLAKVLKAWQIMSKIRKTAFEQYEELDQPGSEGPRHVRDMLDLLYKQLLELFPDVATKSNLGRHIHFNQRADYYDIVCHDLPEIEDSIVKELSGAIEFSEFGFESLLHPNIREKALPLYETNHYLESIMRAYTTVFHMIRERTKLDLDGSVLVGKAFSTSKPYLVFRDLETENGRNIQKGMIQILQGVYQAFRNVIAHPSQNETATGKAAAQHLIVASMLARRIERAKSAK